MLWQLFMMLHSKNNCAIRKVTFMNVIAAGIFCFIFYPTAFAYACYKKRWLEWIFLTLIIIFASAISIQQYNEANFVSELNYPMFISAIYGLSLAWFPFPIAYVVLRFLLDDLQHEYPKQWADFKTHEQHRKHETVCTRKIRSILSKISLYLKT